MRLSSMLLLSVCLVGLAAGAGFAGGDDERDDKIKLTDCPAAVQETLKREAFGGKLDDIEKENEKGRVSYEADVKIDGHNYEIVVDEKGTLVHKLLDEDDDEQETEMKLADCPPAVQKTLKREAGEAKIDKVDKQQQQGRTVYETDVKLGGKNYEIVVTEEGLLLAKQLDEDDEEDDDDDDKDEKK